jgi:hypothetical protein
VQEAREGDYTRMMNQRGKDQRWQRLEDVTVLGDEVRCAFTRIDGSQGMAIYGYGEPITVARRAS